METLRERMQARELRCCVYPELVAVERSHPRGHLFEAGTSLKAHDWFVIPLSKRAHDEYHADMDAFEAKHPHKDLLLAFWASIGFVPSSFMDVGMSWGRAQRFKRVMDRLLPK
jgi:hypothetical protein